MEGGREKKEKERKEEREREREIEIEIGEGEKSGRQLIVLVQCSELTKQGVGPQLSVAIYSYTSTNRIALRATVPLTKQTNLSLSTPLT